MILLEPRHFDLVKKILETVPYTFYVFGSRAKGTARALSDLDLCYKGPVDERGISRLIEAFEESDLPFTVDLVDLNRCSPEFRSMIEPDLVEFPKIF